MEITTNTIAELYIKQGYPEKAIDIYNAILELDPGNVTATEKLIHLKTQSQVGLSESESVEEPVSTVHAAVADVVSETIPESITEESSITSLSSDPASQIAKLEGWLKNMQTIRGYA